MALEVIIEEKRPEVGICMVVSDLGFMMNFEYEYSMGAVCQRQKLGNRSAV